MPEMKNIEVREDLHLRLKRKALGTGESLKEYAARCLVFGMIHMDKKPANEPKK